MDGDNDDSGLPNDLNHVNSNVLFISSIKEGFKLMVNSNMSEYHSFFTFLLGSRSMKSSSFLFIRLIKRYSFIFAGALSVLLHISLRFSLYKLLIAFHSNILY